MAICKPRREVLPSQSSEGTDLDNTLISDFQPPELWDNVSVVQATQCKGYVWLAPKPVFFRLHPGIRQDTSCGCLVAQSWLFVTPWTVAHQALLSMGILQARILELVAVPSSRGFSQPRDQTQVSHITGGFFTIWATWELIVFKIIRSNSLCKYLKENNPNWFEERNQKENRKNLLPVS